MPKYLVETISIFRHRYMIECKNINHAKDEVIMNAAEEFSQKHIEENIFSCREITDEEVPILYFNDNPYMIGNWGPEHAFKYVNKVNYDGQE